MCVVSVTAALTMVSLMFWWIGASLVHIKRVPMFSPSAPIANAAANCTPVAEPPLATKGTFNSCAACASNTQLPTSSSPGCPPQSKPSMEMKSAPMRTAACAWRVATHLWMTKTPASFKALMTFSGLRPAVSTTLTPSSMMILMMPSKSGCTPTGSRVMLTPNGLSVKLLHFLISSRKPSVPFGGRATVRAVMMPRPPAFETAAAISA
mmetsp:Transcript_84573/g.244377  ORF Transcript_84573/g.244377 Transcript_84573/m.244377 type:complete len:208 (-) Transcript_84573:172-795(-)